MIDRFTHGGCPISRLASCMHGNAAMRLAHNRPPKREAGGVSTEPVPILEFRYNCLYGVMMTEPKTLLAMAGAPQEPSRLADATVVMIDCQNEYVDGMLPLTGIGSALEQCARLLAKAREAGTPIIHVMHEGRAGGAFDLDGHGGRIAEPASPEDGEAIVKKPLPNAFARTQTCTISFRTSAARRSSSPASRATCAYHRAPGRRLTSATVRRSLTGRWRPATCRGPAAV